MKPLKNHTFQWIAVGTLGVMTLGSVPILSTPAQAVSSKTWKKAAIAGAAVTGYGLLKHKGKIATLGAAATAGSYYMYKHKKHKEQAHHHYYRHHYYRHR